MEEKVTLADIFDFTFTKFVTPLVIKIAYIVFIVLAALWWLMIVVLGFANGFAGGLIAIIFGALGAFLMILMYRIMFELVMVIFSIKKNTDRLQ